MRWRSMWIAVGLLAVFGVRAAVAQEPVDDFVARTYTGAAGATRPGVCGEGACGLAVCADAKTALASSSSFYAYCGVNSIDSQ